MLSVSSMALAAMLGSACGTNMANINDCNAALYNTGNCPQAVQYQKGGQDLNYFHVRGNNKPYPDINIYRKLIHFSGCMG